MPIFRTKNEDFFKKWTPQMAYVLGFIAADGSLIENKRGAHFLDIQSTDKEILYKIRKTLGSNLLIGEYQSKNRNYKRRYRLQIGSKEIFKDLLKLGITPKKSKTIKLPKIPRKYLSDFVKGYFDGDGNVWCGYMHKNDRKNPTMALSTRFTSGSKTILAKLDQRLIKEVHLFKTPSILFYGGAYRLCYSTFDSIRLYNFMYSKYSDLCLLRKKITFEKFINGGVA